MIKESLESIKGLEKEYIGLLESSIASLFREFLEKFIKNTSDFFNSSRYSMTESEDTGESFLPKLFEETDKGLRQWKLQLSEKNFEMFFSKYTEYFVCFLENSLRLKRYSPFGCIKLEKVTI